MKIFLIMLTLVIIVGSVSEAQRKRGADLYLRIGVSVPSYPEEFSDHWNVGLGYGGGVGVDFSPSLSIVGTVDYSTFTLNSEKFYSAYHFNRNDRKLSSSSASILEVTGNLKIRFNPTPDHTSLYVTGGLGLFRVYYSDISASNSSGTITFPGSSESALGTAVGLGLEIPVQEKTKIFFECKYNYGFTKVEKTEYFPIRVGFMKSM